MGLGVAAALALGFATFSKLGVPLYLSSIVVACTVGYVLLGT